MEEFDDFCYFKKDLIGHGAFAIVYKGRYKSKNVEVAIKAIAKKNISKAKSLLTKEIRILKELSSLKHENLVTLLKCVEEPTHVFLVMEYCNGGDLGDYLNANHTISESAICHFFAQIARALEAMKMKDIVHRDLKPQNILLCAPNPYIDMKTIAPTDLLVKLADFGFARFLTGDGMAGTLCGSPMYMAPEVIMSLQYCAKADLWSVGTIMYQCLVGKAPFIAQTPQALKLFYEKHEDLCPNLPKICSKNLADLLIRLLKRNPRERIEFSEFFAHDFFKMPAEQATELADRNATKTGRNDIYSVSYGNILRSPMRAKFSTATPAPSQDKHLFNNAPATNNTGIQQVGGSQRFSAAGTYSPSHMPYQQQQRHSAVGSQAYTAALSRLGPNAIERQAPLRPLSQLNSPTTARRAFAPTATTAHTNVGNFTAPRNLNTYNNDSAITDNSSSSRKGVKNTMTDSNDFTFLPPLSEKNTTTRRPLAQFTNAPSALSAGDSPVKQVQVHSSDVMKDDRGDPVPSQRFAYTQMQERRKVSTGNSHDSLNVTSEEKTVVERRLPSVEELNLPETKFVVHEQPRMANRGLFDEARSSLRARPSGIPKSATYGELTADASTIRSSPTWSNEASRKKSSSTTEEPLTTEPDHKENASHSNDDKPQKQLIFDNFKIAETNKLGRTNSLENKIAPYACSERNIEEDNENNAMEESTISQVVDSITNDEHLSTLRRTQQRSSSGALINHSQQQQQSSQQQQTRGGGVLRTSGEAAAAAADLLFFNNATAGMEAPPELEAETVLDDEHRQTLAKLRFVLELIETLINVAEKKTNPMAMIMEGGTRKSSRQQSSGSTPGSGSSEVSRRAEQLVLYVRSLHVLSSALVMAQRQINADTLKPSPAVQTVLNNLNEKYHHCLGRSQELASLGIPGMDPSMCVVSAERIMYQHAIDLCQSAALDELFGHPQLCPKRYQTAYMMLHTLHEQPLYVAYTLERSRSFHRHFARHRRILVQNEQDKNVLAKYKSAVEKRMRILEQQGFVTAVDTKSDDPIHSNHTSFHRHHHGSMTSRPEVKTGSFRDGERI